MIAVALLAISFNSCGGDEPDDPAKIGTYTFKDLLTFTLNIGDYSVNNLSLADYTLVDLAIPSSKANGKRLGMIKVQNVTFDPRMPQISFNVSSDFNAYSNFELHKTYQSMIYGYLTNVPSLYMVDDNGNQIESRYKVSDLTAMVDEQYGVTTVAYTVGDNQWRVVSISGTVISKTFTQLDDNNNPTAYKVALNTTNMTAELFLFNVQFEVDGMKSPVLKKISIPGLKIEKTNYGLLLTGNDITPNYYMNDQPTPYPSLNVTDFTATINVLSAKMSLNFDCHGGNYYDTEIPLYLYK